ncbi:MAG: PorP/SprF family type IX secretion system membrane protein [Flavobacteriales bacterium]|nr:PorP/SprF family type IX secretion system membrane protein [Bacteroidota bacterium]MCB9239965.1 PorP/SprF family type IX secretion system membrane protein [Flavobacteriales bacterium]
MFKTLKRRALLLILIGTSFGVKAQQDPYYSHFKFNRTAYNPAAVGQKDEYICLSAIMHQQWLGFDDRTWVDRNTGAPVQGGEIQENVAPVTMNFNLNGQIRTNKGQKLHGGWGVSAFRDRLGFMSTTCMKFQGAYFIPVQGNFGRLSLGVDAGFTDFGFINPAFRYRQPNDPRIPSTGVSQSKFDLGFGVYYTQKRLTNTIEDFYVGASLSHLNGSTYNLVWMGGSNNYFLDQHLYFPIGATIFMANPAYELEPAILVKYNSKLQIDLNATVKYNQTYRAGLGYRQWGTIDALTVMLGYIKNELQVGYSYDITLSKIRTVSSGTHELMVAYCFQLHAPPPPPNKFYRGTRWL